MILAKQNNDKLTESLSASLYTMKKENNSRCARVEKRIDENANALEAMQTRIELTILRKPQRERAELSPCRCHRLRRIVH